MRKAAATLGTIFTMSATVIGAVAGSIIWIENSISSAVAPVQAQTQQNTTAIAGIQTDIKWIREALQSNGVVPRTTSTYQR